MEGGAHKLHQDLRLALEKVSDGGRLGVGEHRPLDWPLNPKGSLSSELMSYVSSLNDVDSWYSIMMSTLVGQLLNNFAKFQRQGEQVL